MKIMLLQNVSGTGNVGDVKEVPRGFAQNYLLPRKLAVVADDRVVEQLRQREEAARRREAETLAKARNVAGRMRRLTLTLYAKTGEGGRLYGSITNADVAQQLKRESGIEVDKRKIEVEPAIKSLGPHEVTVRLHPEVEATVRVVIAAQQ